MTVSEIDHAKSREKRHNTLVVVMLSLLVVLVYLRAGDLDRHGWRTIEIWASCTPPGGLVIDTEHHDIGVAGPGDELV